MSSTNPWPWPGRLGASLTINVASDREWVRRYAADKGSFDVMIECSGNERALRDGLEVMRPRGVVVQLGLGGDVSLPQNTVVTKELVDLRGRSASTRNSRRPSD